MLIRDTLSVSLNLKKSTLGDLEMAAVVDKDLCTGCEACVSACPVEAITVDGIAVISDDCIDCGACVGECPCEAISL